MWVEKQQHWSCKSVKSVSSRPLTGHPEETSKQRPLWAAVADRRSLWVQEEGGGGAHRSQRKNCKTSSKAPSPRYVETNRVTKASASCLHMVKKKKKKLTLCVLIFQEKRRAERAEQQRIRAEKDKERQARREVCSLWTVTLTSFFWFIQQKWPISNQSDQINFYKWPSAVMYIRNFCYGEDTDGFKVWFFSFKSAAHLQTPGSEATPWLHFWPTI